MEGRRRRESNLSMKLGEANRRVRTWLGVKGETLQNQVVELVVRLSALTDGVSANVWRQECWMFILGRFWNPLACCIGSHKLLSTHLLSL